IGFNISTDNITLDCNGYSITGTNASSTWGIYLNAINATIKNCTLSGARGSLCAFILNGNNTADFVFQDNVLSNPSHGQFSVLFSDNSQKDIQILSVIGKEIFRTNSSMTSLEINIPNLAAGIYFVRVIYPGTSVVMTKKIMIQ
ncbi:MAG: T9SS type A sorting domain-containing protein, partial [Alphaproteobacteria bacterium]|nr:T9SS type A sorting domain-containing protein [Alphaproteobacteria bacterium]